MEFYFKPEDFKEVIINKLEDYDLKEVIEECAYEKTEEYMDKKLSKGQALEELVIKCAKEQTDEWLHCNINNDILEECVKEAILERLREFSFEQIKELMNGIK